MRRAICIALGIGAIVSSAAAIGIGASTTEPVATPSDPNPTATEMRRSELSARDAQRSRIEARYQAERAQCDALGGVRRDRCLIAAHAHRGRALLEAAGPYQRKS